MDREWGGQRNDLIGQYSIIMLPSRNGRNPRKGNVATKLQDGRIRTKGLKEGLSHDSSSNKTEGRMELIV